MILMGYVIWIGIVVFLCYHRCRTMLIDERPVIQVRHRCRHKKSMFVTPVVCIAVVSLAVWCAGCGKKNAGVSAVHRQELELAKRVPRPKVIEHPDGTLEVEFGDLLLRLPPAPRYTLNPPSPGRWGWNRGLGWTLEAPTLQTWESELQANGRHAPEKLANIVRLRLYADGSYEPIRDPVPPRDPSWALSGRTRLLRGPIENASLGLLEYRNSKDWPYLYVSPEETFVAIDGQRPFVICPGSPTEYWGGYRLCHVQGFLSSQVKYDYTFTDKWLADWPNLEKRMQELLRSMIVSSN